MLHRRRRCWAPPDEEGELQLYRAGGFSVRDRARTFHVSRKSYTVWLKRCGVTPRALTILPGDKVRPDESTVGVDALGCDSCECGHVKTVLAPTCIWCLVEAGGVPGVRGKRATARVS